MLLLLSACFQINSTQFDTWKNNHSDSGAEIQQIPEFDIAEIPAGTFQMGCTEGDSECLDYEEPVHSVTITRAFMMMKTEVTQELYEAVTGENPSNFPYGDDFPVEMVNWFDAVRFANELSRLEGRDECYSILEGDSGTTVDWSGFECDGWRLPTEAEWEYAAKGGQNFIYAGSDNLDEVAWFDQNSENQTQEVGQKEPNGFGLYDMSGNVYEWVWDWRREYSTEEQSDPIGDVTGAERGYRGGCWTFAATFTRVSRRDGEEPFNGGINTGFRLVHTL